MPSTKGKDKSVLGRLASELDDCLSMTEAVAIPGGDDWELYDEEGSRDAAYALTRAAKKAQEYITKEAKKADKMGEDEAIDLTRKAKKEICLPVHKLHSKYGAMDRESVDALDAFLADVAGEQTGVDKKSIYLSL